MFQKTFFLSALACFISVSSAGQPLSKDQPPKIGLALSGGGAKGMAHIGILQVLDDVGIKPDFITGTSAGGIIGSLYAMGYSADSIKYIASNSDWSDLLSNKIPYHHVVLEEKDLYNRFLLEFPFVHGAPSLPSGLIDGQAISMEFSRLSMPVAHIKDFSKFPIPFTCYASNLENGKLVALTRGNIAEAVRATMAIPSVFTPVWCDSDYLVDGGVLRNFPVSDLKKMGADIIIGVNVGGSLSKYDKLQSLSDVLVQTVFLASSEDDSVQRSLCNILIEPDLHGYSTSSFYAIDSIIVLGEKAGENFRSVFQHLKDSLQRIYPSMFTKKIELPSSEPIIIRAIEVTGVDSEQKKFITDKITIPLNKEISDKVISNAITNLYGTLAYSKILYELFPDENGYKLQLKVTPAPKSNVRGSVNYNSFFGGSLIFNMTMRDLWLTGSRLLLTAGIGDELRARGNYNVYLGLNRNWRTGIEANFDQYEAPLYIQNVNYQSQITAVRKFTAFTADVKGERSQSNIISFGPGMAFDFFSAKNKISTDTILKNVKATDFRPYLFFNLNSMNSAYFPTKGTIATGSLNYVFDYVQHITLNPLNDLLDDSLQQELDAIDKNTANDFFQFTFSVKRYSEFSKRVSLINSVYGGFTSNSNNVLSNNYAVGGTDINFRNNIPFVGLKEFQVPYYNPTQISNVMVYHLGLQYRVFNNLFLIPRVNIGMTGVSFSDFTDRISNFDNYLIGYGVTFGYKSILGPLEVTLMGSNQFSWDLKVYLNLGYSFY